MNDFWKNKRIIAYVALLHHTRFIIPIMETLSGLGAQVRYIVAQAERSQEITAVECGLDYTHVFDYLSNEDIKDIQDNYLRQRKTFSRAIAGDFALATQLTTVMDKTLFATAQEYIGFRNLIRDEKPDLCFALHEVNRWGKMLAFWAKKFNTPFISLQEGLGYDENFGYIGHVQYSTLDLVWGERIKKKFSGYEAPTDRIIPVGNTHISREKRYQEKENRRETCRKKLELENAFVPLLLFSSILPDAGKFIPLFETIAGQPHLKLVIKFHPACRHSNYETWKTTIPQNLTKKITFIHGEESTYDLISACDLCVLARPSTTGIESIALGKPLVQLDLASPVEEPYSFVDQKVALEMTPESLARALADKMDFSGQFQCEDIDTFLKNELTETTGATDRIISILEKTIAANQTRFPPSLQSPVAPKFEWSFIIPVPGSAHNEFLFQLETISRNTGDQDRFQVILIEPARVSEDTARILDSLTGDVVRIQTMPEDNFFDTVNSKGVCAASGQKLILFSELACPLPGWITALSKGFETYGTRKVMGGKVINKFENIVHAGMVLNANNAPVSAYAHLNSRFPKANEQRAFIMLDHLLALSKDFFSALGGFSPQAGAYAFLDLCLKARQYTKDPDACIYLPELEILKNQRPDQWTADSSIYFYGKWHGTLWENEDALYKQDGITNVQLDAARLARAQEVARQI